MRCHYEVLGLERTATADEIKKAYRKLALKWHPDKNVNNADEATERFKEVTAAQTVLSDPHERKWYDDHREAILRGGTGTAQDGETDSPILNLWKFFNSSCYSGSSGPEGFFTVYGNLFSEIYEIDGRDIGADKQNVFVSFGEETSDSAEVFQFYSEWSNFVSQLSFSWEDEYNTLEAPNRLVKRAMEKENKKKRDAAKRKYVETVRALVEYVKRRDTRYIRFEREARKRQEEVEAARVKKNQDRKEKKQRDRAALREVMQGELEEERILRLAERKGAFLLADISDDEMLVDVNGNEGMLDEGDNDCSNSEEERREEEEQVFCCDICQKEFKSEAQQQQHFTSKVHRKKAQDAAKAAKKGKGREKRANSTKTAPAPKDVPRDSKVTISSKTEENVFSFSQISSISDAAPSSIKKAGDCDSSSDEDDISDSMLKLSNVRVSVLDESEDEKEATTLLKDGMEYEIITPGGSKDTGDSERLGKSKVKKKGGASEDHTASSSRLPSDTICKICGYDAQGSRNKLFQHVKDFGHAAFKDDIANTQTVQKMSKKEKKKNKNGGGAVRRNDYRF